MHIMKQPPFSYVTIAFAPVIFLGCTNDRDGYPHRLIFFHGRSVCGSLGKRRYFLFNAYWIF